MHNSYGYGLFTGGMGAHYGAERVGATVVPVSGGLSKRQVMLWQDFGSTVLMSTPSYALVLSEQAKEMGVNPLRDLKLKVGFFGAEPWTMEMKREIETKLNLEAFDIYGLTEMMGPGVSSECPYHDGLHIAEDHLTAEMKRLREDKSKTDLLQKLIHIYHKTLDSIGLTSKELFRVACEMNEKLKKQ